jgi:glucosylceramidase
MGTLRIIKSSKSTGEKLAEKGNLELKPLKPGEKGDIILDPAQRFQAFIGFGGAFTEAAAYTLSKIPAEKRKEALKSYFDKESGLGYSMGRVHIHSCDFALGNYTYVAENDKELKTFDISHDTQLIIPMLKDAEAIRGEELKILASPWSPPAWMKDNKEMNHGGKLLPEFRETWARYFTKFIKAYAEKGIPIWAVTIQNEPEACQRWDSCLYTEEDEKVFLRDYLGPIMEAEGLSGVKICIWDHNMDVIVRRATGVISDPQAAKYAWGTAFHWYVAEDFENVGKVHDLFPDKHLIFSEGCVEGGPRPGEWFTGERYGRNIIHDLNNWTEAWLDWNLVLNEEGGPNHVKNFCDAPIIADTRSGQLTYNSSYYYIGHFSKFIKPGAVRIGTDNHLPELYATSFINEDGAIAAVIMNESDSPKPFKLQLKDSAGDITLEAHSIVTCVG